MTLLMTYGVIEYTCQYQSKNYNFKKWFTSVENTSVFKTLKYMTLYVFIKIYWQKILPPRLSILYIIVTVVIVPQLFLKCLLSA